MINHTVRVHRSEENLAREDQLAHKIAQVAVDPVQVEQDVTEMIINRIIDNASVAVASLHRAPIVAARAQALDHAVPTGGKGSSVFGLQQRTSPEWAAWANGVAVRELDFHDTFLAAEVLPPRRQHSRSAGRRPAHRGPPGADLIRGLATGYEIQVNLVKAICLHKHKIDHVAHLGPSAAAGIGTLLGLNTETIFQAVGQALHTTTATRQSRKGEISTWKAHAPAFAAKLAVEAVDRAMRGQTSPVPIYEGEDGVVAWMLDGPDARYEVPMPQAGETKRAILDTYTKEHSAEYQAQAWIDLARKLHGEHPEAVDPQNVESIVIRTSHHTHYVIGTGANDPQKYEPHRLAGDPGPFDPLHLRRGAAGRRVAPCRLLRPRTCGTPQDTVELWHKVVTEEDPEWTRRYHSLDISEKAFGGSVEIRMRTAASSRMTSPSPMPIHWVPGPSPASSTSANSAAWLMGCSSRARSNDSSTSPRARRRCRPDSWSSSTCSPAGAIDLASSPKGLF